MTTKEARRLLQGIVSRFAHIDLHEVHLYAFNQIGMETVRLIAKENTKKTDAFISLIGELAAHRDSVLTVFATADPAVVFTFTYRYLLMLRYLASASPDTHLSLSADSKRFLEQMLVELYSEVNDTVYKEISTHHAMIGRNGRPASYQDEAPHSR